jgi:hypothetical protein
LVFAHFPEESPSIHFLMLSVDSTVSGSVSSDRKIIRVGLMSRPKRPVNRHIYGSIAPPMKQGVHLDFMRQDDDEPFQETRVRRFASGYRLP